MRVCCANPTCRHLAAVIDEDKAAELEAEAQTAAAQGHLAGAADPFCDGNRRHGSPKLFFDNVCYVRELYVRRVVDAAGVDALLADLARLAYWVEVRQRETLGVAITIARNAETLHYPLRTSEAKSAFCDDMARAPHRFVCTVVADHVKDEVHFSRAGVEISSGGRRGQKQTWQSYLKNTLMHAKGYPDAFTLAHTHLRLSTFETNGCPVERDANGGNPTPRHVVRANTLAKCDRRGDVLGAGTNPKVYEGARAFHEVVFPALYYAHTNACVGAVGYGVPYGLERVMHETALSSNKNRAHSDDYASLAAARKSAGRGIDSAAAAAAAAVARRRGDARAAHAAGAARLPRRADDPVVQL